jgi:hypothetical protein
VPENEGIPGLKAGTLVLPELPMVLPSKAGTLVLGLKAGTLVLPELPMVLPSKAGTLVLGLKAGTLPPATVTAEI